MKNIIRHLILWAEKGRVYVGVSLLLALIAGLASWSLMWGVIVFVFLIDLKVFYETFSSFGYKDYNTENWNVLSALLALALTCMGVYFLHRYLGGKEVFASSDLLLKVELLLFVGAVVFYSAVRCWLGMVKWAHKS